MDSEQEQAKHCCLQEERHSNDTHGLTDPVCGMSVQLDAAHGPVSHAGQDYLFCNTRCLEKFKADPARYTASETHAEPAEVGVGHTTYTCPMCLEVRRGRPGPCPKCGMALEPESASPAVEDSAELMEMSRRFRVCAVLTVPLFLYAMADVIPGKPLHGVASAGIGHWIQLALATPVVLWGGWPFFKRGWDSIASRSLNMFTLIAVGVGVAYGYSLVATLIPGLFPAAFRGKSGEVAVYFEAAAITTTLVLLGQVLELKARSRTSSAIRALLELAPPSHSDPTVLLRRLPG